MIPIDINDAANNSMDNIDTNEGKDNEFITTPNKYDNVNLDITE